MKYSLYYILSKLSLHSYSKQAWSLATLIMVVEGGRTGGGGGGGLDSLGGREGDGQCRGGDGHMGDSLRGRGMVSLGGPGEWIEGRDP